MDLSYFDGIKSRNELRFKMQDNIPEGYSRNQLEKIFSEIKKHGKEIADEELKAKCVDYKQQTQKYMDTNRIERKSFREEARLHNAILEYNKEIVSHLSKLKPFTIKHQTLNNKSVGIIHLTDIHFNELINIKGNRYDFTIASKRLKLLAMKAKVYFKAMNVSTVLIAFTGDILNNDAILDKLLNQATNRAKASLLAFHVLEQFMLDINKDFNIHTAAVPGNEGRAKTELGYSDICATDNYDYTVYNMLKIAFRNCPGVEMDECDSMEKTVEINNNIILLMHGLAIKSDIESSITQTMGRVANEDENGKKPDYVLMGHIHSARIGDLYARGSSMAGANSYSKDGLNLSGRASQNIAIFYDNKSHDVFKIDLQHTDNIEGYNIIKELETYDAKSASKAKKKTVIFQIVA